MALAAHGLGEGLIKTNIMENNTKKYILYFTLIVVLFLTIVLFQLWSKKKLEMEQKEVAKRFIDMEFSGIVNQYEEIPEECFYG